MIDRTIVGDKGDEIDQLVDLAMTNRMNRDRGYCDNIGSCPNPKCFQSWHGMPTAGCPGSHVWKEGS